MLDPMQIATRKMRLARLSTAVLATVFCLHLSLTAQVTVTATSSVPIGTAMNGAAYGNGVYVAVGAGGDILLSLDGIHFTPEQTAASFLNTTYNHVAFGNGLFVAVSQDGYIATSSDGITWTQRSSAGAPALYSDLYAGGQWITVGYNGFVATSPDGITWTSVNAGGAAGDVFDNIVYFAGKYVIGDRDAATGGANAVYSTTGASGTWTKVNFSSSTNALNVLEALNNTLYAFTSSGAIFTSTNITSWTQLSNSTIAGTGNQMFDGLYYGGTYYVFGYTAAQGYTSVGTSTDGINWTLETKSAAITVQHVTVANGIFYELGNEGLTYSTTGSNFLFPAGSYFGVATNGSLYVAVGQTDAADDAIFTSPDWSTWTARSVTNVRALNAITYGNGKFVAVGNTDPTATFSTYATSADGITWTSGYTGFVNNLRGVAYGNGKYVAVGLNGTILYSTNGTAWSLAEAITGYHYYAISYVNNYFIAVGGTPTLTTGKVKVKYSVDGVTWTDVSPNVVGTFSGVTYGGGKYVFVGRDNTIGSLKFFSQTMTNITNTTTWSATSNSITPTLTLGTAGYGPVTYGNGQYVSIANVTTTPFAGYVLTSTDGLSWTATSANSTGRLRGILYNSSNDFKAVGLADIKLDITAGLPLPLTLLSFTGQHAAGKNILNWETSNEVNTRDFEIEWSPDGKIYSFIGSVPAAGNSAASLNYTFTQSNPPAGTDFYRLRMVDIDGHYTYSNIVELTVVGENTELNVWPNPIQGETLNISLPSGTTFPVSYSLYDGNGKTILRGQLTQPTQIIPVGNLSKGSYTLRLSNGAVRKLVKL